MSVADDIYAHLTLAGTERAAQAKHDKAAFAAEKRGYAARLCIVLSYLRQNNFHDAGPALAALIAELEDG